MRRSAGPRPGPHPPGGPTCCCGRGCPGAARPGPAAPRPAATGCPAPSGRRSAGDCASRPSPPPPAAAAPAAARPPPPWRRRPPPPPEVRAASGPRAPPGSTWAREGKGAPGLRMRPPHRGRRHGDNGRRRHDPAAGLAAAVQPARARQPPHREALPRGERGRAGRAARGPPPPAPTALCFLRRPGR